MQLSKAAEYAVRGAIVLADRYGQGPVPLVEICRVRGLSKSFAYMTKIFRILARRGVVRAIRGKNGGYTLARPPAKTTLLEVIEAIEGRLALNLCQHTPPQCHEPNCPVRPVWTQLQEQVRSVLGSKTLAQLTHRPRRARR